jgi:hypothetical protein
MPDSSFGIASAARGNIVSTGAIARFVGRATRLAGGVHDDLIGKSTDLLEGAALVRASRTSFDAMGVTVPRVIPSTLRARAGDDDPTGKSTDRVTNVTRERATPTSLSTTADTVRPV